MLLVLVPRDEEVSGAAVPLPPEETWRTVCSAPGHLGNPFPPLEAASPHGLQESTGVNHMWLSRNMALVLSCGELTEGA